MDLELLEDDLLEFDAQSNKLDKGVDPENSEVDFNALQQAFDTTWGRSSTPRTAQFSVKFHLDGSQHMVASYCAIVNFASERQMVDQKRRYASESTDVVAAHVKFVKERYKKLSGKTLSVKETNAQDSIEVIGMNFYNPKRTAYYRLKVIFEIG